MQKKKLTGLNILLAEDQEFNQILVKSITKNWECNLEIAENGEEAVRLVKEKPFDLILMDVKMPVMGGIEATRIIRNELKHDKSILPIIAVTANKGDVDDDYYHKHGLNDYISKPITSGDLFEKIQYNLKMKNTDDSSEPKIHEKNSQLYDLSQIKDISGGNKEDEQTLIRVFIEQTEEILDNLRECVAKKEWEKTGETAHKIKSSIVYMGIPGIEDKIIEIENLAEKDQDHTKIEKLVQEISVTLIKIFNELEMYLEENY